MTTWRLLGRKWAFNLTCLFSSVFGLCLGASGNYTTFLVLTAFVGFGVGGNIPIDTTITLEFIPQDKRFLLATLSIFQPIGVVLCSAIAFGFIPTMSCSPNFSEKDPLPSCNAPGLQPEPGGAPCCGRENNMGWRYLLFTLGAITLAVFFLRCFVFRFRESPKFLVYKGQDGEAIKVVHHIANTNGTVCRLSLEHFEALSHGEGNPRRTQVNNGGGGRPGLRTRMSSTLGRTVSGTVSTIKRMRPSREKVADQKNRYLMLFSNVTMARLTILVWLTYIFDFWGFTVAGQYTRFCSYVACHARPVLPILTLHIYVLTGRDKGFYLPRILALKNGAASEGNSLTFTYASYIYTYAPGAVGVLLGSLMYRAPSFGRKWTMTISSGLMGASILLFSIVDTVPKNLGMFTMEYFFQSMFNAVLYGWTPEAFPAPVRGTACGLASFWGRLFGIVSPLIAQSLYGRSTAGGGTGDVNAVLYLAGGVTLGCVVTTALLPNKALQSSDGKS
jgi:MFS family permease